MVSGMLPEHRCEWSGCKQRWAHFVSLPLPRHPESMYVCDLHLQRATAWLRKLRTLRGVHGAVEIQHVMFADW